MFRFKLRNPREEEYTIEGSNSRRPMVVMYYYTLVPIYLSKKAYLKLQDDGKNRISFSEL